MLRLFDRTVRRDTIADQLFADCVRRSRDVRFYRDCGVDDTVGGRFEMLALQVALLMRRLGQIEPAGADTSRALAEAMFASLDDDMRELGVGYLSVPKKMRKTAAAFYGRATAYAAALADGADENALVEALQRNVYGGGTASPEAITRLAGHVRDESRRLAAAPDEDLLSARGDGAQGRGGAGAGQPRRGR